jgi:hypothetical protein
MRCLSKCIKLFKGNAHKLTDPTPLPSGKWYAKIESFATAGELDHQAKEAKVAKRFEL